VRTACASSEAWSAALAIAPRYLRFFSLQMILTSRMTKESSALFTTDMEHDPAKPRVAGARPIPYIERLGHIVTDSLRRPIDSELIAELIGSAKLEDYSPVLIKAAMAHLNLTAIHPFLKGMDHGKALHTLVLARPGISPPAVASSRILSVEHVSTKSPPGSHRRTWPPPLDALKKHLDSLCLTAHLHQPRPCMRLTGNYTGG